jgi:hypothetical protein
MTTDHSHRIVLLGSRRDEFKNQALGMLGLIRRGLTLMDLGNADLDLGICSIQQLPRYKHIQQGRCHCKCFIAFIALGLRRL